MICHNWPSAIQFLLDISTYLLHIHEAFMCLIQLYDVGTMKSVESGDCNHHFQWTTKIYSTLDSSNNVLEPPRSDMTGWLPNDWNDLFPLSILKSIGRIGLVAIEISFPNTRYPDAISRYHFQKRHVFTERVTHRNIKI